MKYLTIKIFIILLINTSIFGSSNLKYKIIIDFHNYLSGKTLRYKISNNIIKIYKINNIGIPILIKRKKMSSIEFNNFAKIQKSVYDALINEYSISDGGYLDGFYWKILFRKQNKEFIVNNDNNANFDKMIIFINHILDKKAKKIPTTKSFYK